MKTGVINAVKNMLECTVENNKRYKTFGIEQSVVYALQFAIISKAEDITCLVNQRRYGSVPVIFRSLFEQYVYLKYILQKHTSQRARLYYYSYMIQQAEKTLKIIDRVGEIDGFTLGKFPEISRDLLDNNIKTTNNDFENAEQYIKFYKQKYKELLMTSPKKVNYEKWYNITGNINNFRDIMNAVGLGPSEYEFYYSLTSMNVHGIDVVDYMHIQDGKMSIEIPFDSNSTLWRLNWYLIESSKLINKYFGTEKDLNIKKDIIHLTFLINRYKVESNQE